MFLKKSPNVQEAQSGVRSLVGTHHGTEGTGLLAEKSPHCVLGSHSERSPRSLGLARPTCLTVVPGIPGSDVISGPASQNRL